MEVRLLAAAEISVLDQRTNGLSIINIIDELGSPAFPFIVPRVSIVAILEREMTEPETYEGFSFSAHFNGQVPFSVGVGINFQGKPKLRSLMDVGGLVIQTPGTLRIALNREGTELAAWYVQVIQIGGPEPTVITEPVTAAPRSDAVQPT
jgi:uncharacterized protein DUF6941